MKPLVLIVIIATLVLTILVFGAIQAFALDSFRFDWANGGSSQVLDDTTTTCNNQATIRYDWVNGEPGQQFDTTATCDVATDTGGIASYKMVVDASYAVVVPTGYTLIIQ